MKERIQKLLATAGYGSRREIERWIAAGDVLVNGQVASLGQQINTHDKVMLRGKPLNLEARLRATPKVLAYHKKAGEVCTRNDPEGRPTVFDHLPPIRQGRWVMIGRLDVNTDGLLLFTTDGELANRLMHPSAGVEREYASRILGDVDNEVLERLQAGVELEDGTASFLRIRDGGGEGANHWYHVVLAEGRNREVRRLWESQGLKVSRLIRVRYGSINLARNLRSGHHEELDVKAIRRLYESVGMTFDDGTRDEHKGKRTSAATSSASAQAAGQPATPATQTQPRPRARPQSRTERRAETRREGKPASRSRAGASRARPGAGAGGKPKPRS